MFSSERKPSAAMKADPGEHAALTGWCWVKLQQESSHGVEGKR